MEEQTLDELFSFCHLIIKFSLPFALPWKYKTSSNIRRQIPDYLWNPNIYLFIYLFIHLFIYLFICLIIYLSIYLFNILCIDYDKEGCRNKVLSSHSMSHYHKRRYHVWVLCVEATFYEVYGGKMMFSSIWLI